MKADETSAPAQSLRDALLKSMGSIPGLAVHVRHARQLVGITANELDVAGLEWLREHGHIEGNRSTATGVAAFRAAQRAMRAAPPAGDVEALVANGYLRGGVEYNDGDDGSVGPRPVTMSATVYQRWTDETAIGGYPEAGTGSQAAINYAVIGLNDEAGEVAGKWKKLLRGDDVNDEARKARVRALQDEVGDVLWYAARIAEETGTTLDAIMQRNRVKLMDRKHRGVIRGDGDKR